MTIRRVLFNFQNEEKEIMAIFKRKNSKYYWMKFYFEGELIQQSTKCTNKADARTVESAYRTELALGRIGIKIKRDYPTFQEAIKGFLEWSKISLKQSTQKREKFAVDVLEVYFGKKKVDAIEPKDVEKFVTWRSNQTSRKTQTKITRGTVNRELIILKKIFKRLVNEKVLLDSPARTVKLLKENDASFHVITDDEERLYLMACPQPLQDVAIIMLETGMRCGEVYRIKRGEVFLEKGFLKVTEGKTNTSVRRVHLSEKAKNVLRHRLKKFQGENLFPQGDKDGQKATDSLDKQHITTIGKLNFKFRLYDCRHTFATRALENGVDILTLSQILGHNGLKTISRYAHPSESFKADAIKKMQNRKLAKLA